MMDIFQHFFDISPDLMLFADFRGSFLEVNPSLVHFLQQKKENLFQKNIFDFIYPDDIASTQVALQKLKTGEKVVNFECRIKSLGGEFRWTNWSGSMCPVQSGFCAIGRDVDTFKKAFIFESQLNEALLHAAIVGVTDKSGTILYANQNFQNISGYDLQELVGKNHRLLNSGFHSSQFFQEMRQTIRSGEIWKGEIKNKKKDGSFYWVYTHIIPIFDTQQKISHYVAIRFDITKEKALTHQWENNNKVIALGELAANIAHEINNPLTILKGKLHLLTRICQESLSSSEYERTTPYLEKMDTTLDRIELIIKTVMSIGRSSAKDAFEIIQIESLVQRAVDYCREKLQSNGICCQMEVRHKNLMVKGQVHQLLQALINLIYNSVDALENIDEKWIKIIIDKKADQLLLSVVDAGLGIEISVVARIFEPFFSTKDVGKGTGLGLSLTHKIITFHGGQVKVDTDHENTKFDIQLQLALVE